MNHETENLLGKYKYLIGLIILTSIFILWGKPRIKEDCLGFGSKIFINACLSELPEAKKDFKPVVTPPSTPPLVINLARLEFTEVKLEPVGTGANLHYILSGSLRNRSAANLKNIQILVNFYNFGDDPEKVSPIGTHTINLKDELPAGHSIRIKEIATNDQISLPNTSFSWNWKINSAEAIDPR